MKKEMLINVLQPEECRIAIIEDGVLEELYLERTSHESYTGNIYKGKIVNLEPAIQAAFVDFSVGRNGFLHVSDVEPQYYRKHLGDEGDLGPRDREPRRDLDEPRRDREPPRRDRDRPPEGRPPEGRPPEGRPPEGRPPEGRPPEGRPPEGRYRDRDRERPDRSEKGRRDRTPRRFGEGLTDDDDQSSPPFSPPRHAEPTPAPRPPVARLEPPDERRVASDDTTVWLGEPQSPEPDASLGWSTPKPAESIDFEAELPPSRTHRQRPTPPPEDITELLRPRPTPPARELAGEPDIEPRLPAPEARRHRGRSPGAPPPPPRPAPSASPLVREPAVPEPDVVPEPVAHFDPEREPPFAELPPDPTF